jgi:hypothetical protein
MTLPIFDPASHVVGPGKITFNGGTFMSSGDIAVRIAQEFWPVQTSLFGTVGRRAKNLPIAEITVPLDGQVAAANIAVLFPYLLSDIGKSVYTAAEVPLVIDTLAGQKFTFARAAITGLPGVKLSTGSTAYTGNLTFTALMSSTVAAATANAFLTIAAEEWSDDTFDETAIISPGYTAAYGLSPFATIESLDGFSFTFGMSVAPISVDRYGVCNHILTELLAECRFTPAGMTEANWKTLTHLDGTSVTVPGQEIGSGSTDLIVSGTGLTVTLYKANIQAAGLAYGISAPRLGELVFFNRAVFADGAPAALYDISVG